MKNMAHPSKPDIDALIKATIERVHDNAAVKDWQVRAPNYTEIYRLKVDIFSRLAAEAVEVQIANHTASPGLTRPIKALPLSKLKAIMEIKE